MNKIKEDFRKVLAHSAQVHIDDIKYIDQYFDQWAENKKDFILAFGGELIKEYPNVSFKIDQQQRSYFYDAYSGHQYSSELSLFLDAQGLEGFFENKIIADYRLGEDKIIPKGMKISKALKFFCSEEKHLRKLQDEYSMIIQQDRITGTLCFSVHPLDYLSISENTLGWRSCHALDGEYRAGNLSYMLDSSTIVCYLRADEQTVLPRFPSDVPWNNKKWRCLLFFDPDRWVCYAGRQYPFFTEEGLRLMRNGVIDLFKWRSCVPWTKSETNIVHLDFVGDNIGDWNPDWEVEHPYVVIGERIYDQFDLVKNVSGSLNYNDLTHSTCYTPYRFWEQSWGTPDKCKRFHIGSTVICPKCGQYILDSEEDMLCAECAGNTYQYWYEDED